MTTTTLAVYGCEPGDRDAVLRLLAPARAATVKEPGCLYFHTLIPVDQPDRIVLIEGWRTAADLAAHRTTPHFKEIILGSIAGRVRDRSVEICTEPSIEAVGSESSFPHLR